MAKQRRTIGENPLDVTVQGSALDEVIPQPGAAPGADPARAALEAEVKEARQRLADLDAEKQALQGELAQAKERLTSLEEQDRASRQRVGDLEGENQGLQAELAQAQEALKRVKAEAEAAKDATKRPDSLGYTFVRRGQ